jgi:hypothetical protein
MIAQDIEKQVSETYADPFQLKEDIQTKPVSSETYDSSPYRHFGNRLSTPFNPYGLLSW